MNAFDPRLTPARPDLASARLRGQIEAARFVEGEPQRVAWPTVPVRATASPEASLVTETLFGETVTVFETTEEGWAWGQLDADGYVGWLPAEALAPLRAAATHRVAALRTPVFPGPGIKAPPLLLLSLNSRLTVLDIHGRFARTPAGFVFAGHLAPLGEHAGDFVEVAAGFLGAPYLWGGRSSLGLDCSGLVQAALTACGVACPRDSDMQEAALGTATESDPAAFRRGDLLFWPGHVGIVEDRGTLLHATAHAMAVVREPMARALERIAAASAPLRTVRRLTG
ncbi:MAG: C40 family peptidase [Xanthobacteraceae bacterium]